MGGDLKTTIGLEDRLQKSKKKPEYNPRKNFSPSRENSIPFLQKEAKVTPRKTQRKNSLSKTRNSLPKKCQKDPAQRKLNLNQTQPITAKGKPKRPEPAAPNNSNWKKRCVKDGDIYYNPKLNTKCKAQTDKKSGELEMHAPPAETNIESPIDATWDLIFTCQKPGVLTDLAMYKNIDASLRPAIITMYKHWDLEDVKTAFLNAKGDIVFGDSPDQDFKKINNVAICEPDPAPSVQKNTRSLSYFKSKYNTNQNSSSQLEDLRKYIEKFSQHRISLIKRGEFPATLTLDQIKEKVEAIFDSRAAFQRKARNSANLNRPWRTLDLETTEFIEFVINESSEQHGGCSEESRRQELLDLVWGLTQHKHDFLVGFFRELLLGSDAFRYQD
jgi:hypothetical protein